MQLAVAEGGYIQTVILNGFDFKSATAGHAGVLAFDAFDLLFACTRGSASGCALRVDQKGIAVNVFDHAMGFVMRRLVFGSAPTYAVGAHDVVGFDKFEIRLINDDHGLEVDSEVTVSISVDFGRRVRRDSEYQFHLTGSSKTV